MAHKHGIIRRVKRANHCPITQLIRSRTSAKYQLTQEQIFLLDRVMRSIHTHNCVHVGLEPKFRRLQILNVSVHRRLGAQIRRAVSSPQREGIPPSHILPAQTENKNQIFGYHRKKGKSCKHSRNRPISSTLKCQKPRNRIQTLLRNIPFVLALAPQCNTPKPVHRRHALHNSTRRLGGIERVEQSHE